MIESTIVSVTSMPCLFTHIQYRHLNWKLNYLLECLCVLEWMCARTAVAKPVGLLCALLDFLSGGKDIGWTDTFIWTKAPWVSLGKLQVKKLTPKHIFITTVLEERSREEGAAGRTVEGVRSVAGNGRLRGKVPASRRGAERIEFCQKTQHPFHRPEAVSCHLKHFLCNSPDDFLPLCRVFHCSSLCSPV